MVDFLEKQGISASPLTFVFGDTHTGGWGQWKGPSGEDIRIYNCGAWVTHKKNDHPPCHVFAVGKAVAEDGREYLQEYLFDVSFRDVMVEGESLVELAARDAENRPRRFSLFTRLFA
jgi:hypothetical protein